MEVEQIRKIKHNIIDTPLKEIVIKNKLYAFKD